MGRRALLGGSEKINVPLAGPVSFFGFMLLGPALLIVLRVYLQIYVEHSDRLDRLARLVSAARAPTLVPLRNPLIRVFSGLTFYLLLPVAMMLFAWKAAVFPAWGLGLLCVATGVVVSHVMLPFSRFSWRWKGLLSLSAAIIAGGVVLGFGSLRRPFDLDRANLSRQSLQGSDLRSAQLANADLTGANLFDANLSGAYLSSANLSGARLGSAKLTGADLMDANLSNAYLGAAKLDGAFLSRANLTGANLSQVDLIRASLRSANLTGAKLTAANLSGADLSGANLSGAHLGVVKLTGANLSGADLSGAIDLGQWDLDEACGNAETKLPEGLALKSCHVAMIVDEIGIVAFTARHGVGPAATVQAVVATKAVENVVTTKSPDVVVGAGA
jgi:uncharacterized protein YjbI with pentapeptide repeats